jgi:hypothetical protein
MRWTVTTLELSTHPIDSGDPVHMGIVQLADGLDSSLEFWELFEPSPSAIDIDNCCLHVDRLLDAAH